MGKKERQEAILTIATACTANGVCSSVTQEALLTALQERGISCSQATISRDLRELHLVKRHLEDGTVVWQHLEDREGLARSSVSDMSHFSAVASSEGHTFSGILSSDSAGQIAVLHCRPGTASAICAELDSKQNPQIVGTIAGDDTIFVLLRSEEQARNFAEQYQKTESNIQ